MAAAESSARKTVSNRGCIMKKLLMTTIFLGLICSVAHAELIYLKDGRVIRGKIVERGNYYIKVMEGRFPKQYYNEQIEKIMDEEEPFKWDPNRIDANGFPGIPPTKVLLILEHLELNGARINIQRNIELLLDRTPEVEKAKIKDLLRITDLIRVIIPVYAATFTEPELRDMNSFLKTPVGQKMISVAPYMVEDTAKVMADFFRERLKTPTEM